MTIKQQGGIFGRNPTFNNVTIGGTLTVDQIVQKTGAAGITLAGVTIEDGNVVLADGKGIDFSGAGELFDDYEEGQFSPYFYDDINGQWSGSTASSGHYVKVGKVVHIAGIVTWSSKPASGGTLRVRALPYASANPSNPSVPNTDFNNSLGDGIQIRISVTDFLFYDGGSLQGNGLIGTMASSGTFVFNVTYFV